MLLIVYKLTVFVAILNVETMQNTLKLPIFFNINQT